MMKRPITRLELAIVIVLLIGLALYATQVNALYDFIEIAAPANPAANNDRLYADSTAHQLKCLTNSGASCMPSGGGGGNLNLSQIGVGLASLTDPTALAYTWFNQSTATITTNGATLVLAVPNSGANNITGRTTPVTGSSPYTATLGMVPNLINVNSAQCGIAITNGSNFIVIRYRNDSAFDGWTWTGTGTPTTNLFTFTGSPAFVSTPAMIFLQIKETMTTRTYNVSSDGVNFDQFFSESAGTFIVPTRVGFFCLNNTSSSNVASMTATHLLITTP